VRGFAFAGFLQWWTLVAIPLIAFLEALGGSGYGRNWRRVGEPIALCSLLAIALNSYIPLLSILPYHMILRIGYGIPTIAPGKPWDDKGSWLGRIAYWLVGGKVGTPESKKRYRDATIITHSVIAVLMIFSFVPLIWFNESYWQFAGVALLIGILSSADRVKRVLCIAITEQS